MVGSKYYKIELISILKVQKKRNVQKQNEVLVNKSIRTTKNVDTQKILTKGKEMFYLRCTQHILFTVIWCG